MTATSGAFGRPRGEGLLHRAAMLFGHYSARSLPFVYVSLFALNTALWWGAPKGFPLNVVQHTITALFLIALVSEFVHDRNLCLRHIQEAPLLDPQAAVEKHDRALRFAHRQRFFWAACALALVSVFLPTTGKLLPGLLYLKIALTVVAVVGTACLVYVIVAKNTHTRLRPWCPYCDHGKGKGGGEQPAPAPDPVRAGTV